MPFLVSVNTESLRRLMHGWINSSKYQRYLPEGIIIDKLSARNIVLSDSELSIRLIMDLKGRHPNDVTVYKIEELTHEELVSLRNPPREGFS